MTKIIMNYMDDRSLFCLLKTNKYFRSFLQCDGWWKERTSKIFGRGKLEKETDCNLYRTLAKKAIVYEIPLSVYDGDIHGQDQNEFGKIVGKVLDYLNGREYKINYGDLVNFETSGGNKKHGYAKNQGKFIYDGRTLVAPNITEYYMLPSTFSVLTPNQDRIFPLDYWRDALVGNRRVWLTPAALGPISFSIQKYNGFSYIQGTFELDQFYTIIDVKSINSTSTIKEDVLENVKKSILQSEKLVVVWRFEDQWACIDLSLVRGIPLYIF